jgi:hypothetical protein
MILPINIHVSNWQYQDISSKYGHYQHPAVTGRNWLATWTEKSVGTFFSYSVSFSAQALHLLTFLGESLSPEPFFLLLNICPLSRLKPDLYVQGC